MRRKFIVPLGLRTAGPFSHRKADSRRGTSVRLVSMPQSKPLRLLLLAGLGLVAGFLALAIAAPMEPQVVPAVIAIFSPGLKLAELITPESGKSFAWTFGWFLRIAILTNALFYFAIFSFFAYLAGRRRNSG